MSVKLLYPEKYYNREPQNLQQKEKRNIFVRLSFPPALLALSLALIRQRRRLKLLLLLLFFSRFFLFFLYCYLRFKFSVCLFVVVVVVVSVDVFILLFDNVMLHCGKYLLRRVIGQQTESLQICMSHNYYGIFQQCALYSEEFSYSNIVSFF